MELPQKAMYDSLVKAMKRTKIPCRIVLSTSGGICLNLGSGWSKKYRIYNRVDIILKRLGIEENVSVSAISYMDDKYILEMIMINGGVYL